MTRRGYYCHMDPDGMRHYIPTRGGHRVIFRPYGTILSGEDGRAVRAASQDTYMRTLESVLTTLDGAKRAR